MHVLVSSCYSVMELILHEFCEFRQIIRWHQEQHTSHCILALGSLTKNLISRILPDRTCSLREDVCWVLASLADVQSNASGMQCTCYLFTMPKRTRRLPLGIFCYLNIPIENFLRITQHLIS